MLTRSQLHSPSTSSRPAFIPPTPLREIAEHIDKGFLDNRLPAHDIHGGILPHLLHLVVALDRCGDAASARTNRIGVLRYVRAHTREATRRELEN